MTKYHIAKSGNTAICTAKIRCPLGGATMQEDTPRVTPATDYAYDPKNNPEQISYRELKAETILLDYGHGAAIFEIMPRAIAEQEADEIATIKADELAQRTPNQFTKDVLKRKLMNKWVKDNYDNGNHRELTKEEIAYGSIGMADIAYEMRDKPTK